MSDLPLHPALVHLPLGIAILMPILIASVLLGRVLDRLGRGAWVAVLVSSMVLVLSSFVAVRSGEAEEDRVEKVVGEGPLHAHEEAAERFAWSTGVLLLFALLPLAARSRGFAVGTQAVALAVSLVVVVLAFDTGRAGGALVYRHGAASAGMSVASSSAAPDTRGVSPPVGMTGGGHGEEGEDDD